MYKIIISLLIFIILINFNLICFGSAATTAATTAVITSAATHSKTNQNNGENNCDSVSENFPIIIILMTIFLVVCVFLYFMFGLF